MKKYIILFTILAILIGITFIIPKERHIKEDSKLYEKAIKYLTDEEYKVNDDSKKNDFKFFISYHGFGMTEKENYKYAYMWVLGEGFYMKGDKRENSRSYSMFFKFKFKDGKVLSYENAADGSEYKSSINRMCLDKKMSDKVLNYSLDFSNNAEIDKYYKKEA